MRQGSAGFGGVENEREENHKCRGFDSEYVSGGMLVE
jgi:hypothetical protein